MAIVEGGEHLGCICGADDDSYFREYVVQHTAIDGFAAVGEEAEDVFGALSCQLDVRDLYNFLSPRVFKDKLGPW